MRLLEIITKSINEAEGAGIPIGNQTSQWFALCYLHPLDLLITQELKIGYYVRYMDDIVLIHNDKDYLRFCLKEMEEFAYGFGLKFNKKTQIISLKRGVDFLGFTHKLCKNGNALRELRAEAKRRQRRNMERLDYLKQAGRVSYEFMKTRLTSYTAHTAICC
ncbi:MAG: RNA-directed DNA polymerase [Firmicutes bacterium]|nr:RNA-directed DNA polymerase [Bacillota bacterium]